MSLRIGIDLGGTKTEGVVMDADGNILFRERRPTPAAEGYAASVKNIRDIVRHLETRAGARCTVGIGAPGPISADGGMLKRSNTACLVGQPMRDDLQKSLERPIRLANDANCFALSEALDGAGQGAPVVFGVILGTGVGGGTVIDNRIIEGLQHIAGEWGHNPLEADGPACYCGRSGCVETLLSGPGFTRDYALHGGNPNLDAPAIITAAAHGDALADAAIQRYLERFGRALGVIINILDPHVIVLGGGMSNLPQLYTEGRRHVARYIYNDALQTKILPNVHGDSSGVRGAAQLWPADHGLV